MKVLSRMKLWQKLAVLGIAMAVPAFVLGFFYLSTVDAQVRLAEDELDGARYAQAIGVVLSEAAHHRNRLYAVLAGDGGGRDQVVASEAAMEKAIAAVDTIDTQVGARYKVSAGWHALKTEWNGLRADGAKLGSDEVVSRHNAFLDHVMKLSDTIAGRAGLNIDPSSQTAVLIQIATRDIPSALINSGNIRWYAARAAVKGYLGGDDRMAIQLYQETFTTELDATTRELDRVSESAKADLGPKLDQARGAFTTFYATITDRIVHAQKMDMSAAEVFAASSPVSGALQQLSDASYAAMGTAVQERLSKATTWRNLAAAVTTLALAFAFVLSWLITRALARPLSQAIDVFGHIAAGRYDSEIRLTGSDEAAQVLAALWEMQDKLRLQIETERTAAAENTRIRQALDKVTTAVVLADARHRIIYLNETAETTFNRNQAQIRKTLAGFDAQRLRDSSLDSLAGDAGKQRQLIDTLKGPLTQEHQLGECTFRSVSNPVFGEKGERIGTVVEWTDRTPEVAIEREMQQMLTAVVGGDLSARIDLVGKQAFFESISRGVNQLADNLAEVVTKVKAVAAEVHRGADEISVGNANLSQRTEEQSSSLEETASSMEEMTSTVRQNADNAGQANQLAIAARDQAERGGAVVSQAVKAMGSINEASRKIADIIGVIDDIAFQTNLLALNAAVEAARAGEQGRGFAVVASEVRNLAGRSATAAKEIKDLIQDSVRKVEDGSVLVTQSGETLERIVASVKKVSDIVAEIAAASREQSVGIEQVNRAVVQMDEITQQNAALVEQATAASQAMAEQVRNLNQMLDHYRNALRASDVRATSAAPSSKPPTATVPGKPTSAGKTVPPARVERRGQNRPWSGKSGSHAAAPARAMPPQPTAFAPATQSVSSSSAIKAGEPTNESEWEEF